jgi:hypothetical protein
MKFIWRYIAHEDPLVATGNLVALVLGYNTPLYPLYLLWVTGQSGLPWVLLTLCVCPFFLAVPAISRISSLGSRLLLAMAGTLNTIFCTWLLGTATGTELFLIPCFMLAALLFRPNERLAITCAVLPPTLAFFLDSHYPAPRLAYTATQAQAILRLDAASVGTLAFFIGFVFAKLLPQSTKAQSAPHDPETARSPQPHPSPPLTAKRPPAA